MANKGKFRGVFTKITALFLLVLLIIGLTPAIVLAGTTLSTGDVIKPSSVAYLLSGDQSGAVDTAVLPDEATQEPVTASMSQEVTGQTAEVVSDEIAAPVNESPSVIKSSSVLTKSSPMDSMISFFAGLGQIEMPAAPIGHGAWAFANIVITVLGILIAQFFVIKFFFTKNKSSKAKGLNNRNSIAQDAYAFERLDSQKKRLSWCAMATMLSLFAVALFSITENITLPIVLFDQWTIFHVIIFGVQIACFIVVSRETKAQVGAV